jgi:hypothetical protein
LVLTWKWGLQAHQREAEALRVLEEGTKEELEMGNTKAR